MITVYTSDASGMAFIRNLFDSEVDDKDKLIILPETDSVLHPSVICKSVVAQVTDAVEKNQDMSIITFSAMIFDSIRYAFMKCSKSTNSNEVTVKCCSNDVLYERKLDGDGNIDYVDGMFDVEHTCLRNILEFRRNRYKSRNGGGDII